MAGTSPAMTRFDWCSYDKFAEDRNRDGMTTMELGARRIGDGEIGIEIAGLQASRAMPADVQALMRLLAQHGVAVLRDQDLRPADYVKFAKLFGEIEPSTRERYWLPEQNEIYVISNVVENGREIGNPNDGFGWHTDQYYFERPTAYTFLYGVETPPVGADTQFCSTRMIYEELSDLDKQKFSQISIIASHLKLSGIRASEGKKVDQLEFDKCPDVVHPLVRTHPISGKKFLYFSAIRASKPLGMSEAELGELLASLYAKATRPDNVYAHKWRPKDLVIWDNRGLLHTATAYEKDKYRRICYRMSVIGERPYQ
jgi:taurine dioxygenase